MRTDDIILITGKRKSGKSYFLKYLFTLFLNKNARLLIWDYNHEHKIGLSTSSLEQVNKAFKSNIQSITYLPLHKTDKDFNDFCVTAYKLNDIVVVIEEVERYAKSQYIPQGLKDIIDTGRHKGIGLICTTRRTLRLNADIPFNANHIFVFRQIRPQDLKYLSEWVGEEILVIGDLPEFSYMWYNDDTGNVTQHDPIK